MTDVLPCHIHLPVCLWIMDLHSRSPKKNKSHRNEVLPQDTMHLIQRPCYQWGNLCQDPADNRPHEDLLTTVKRRKVQWYGHVSRSSGLTKTILQGTVKGGRRQGRQWKRWEDNIRVWTGLAFTKSQRAVENRGKWRKMVVKSTVVPQGPLRLRGKWSEVNSTCWKANAKILCDRRHTRYHYWVHATVKKLLYVHIRVFVTSAISSLYIQQA